MYIEWFGGPPGDMKTLLFIYTFYAVTYFTFSKAPNVLLIIIDDLRPALGCYGDRNAHTPNIDALAKQSVLFRNAYVQQSLCAPSRNSFLTSRRPDTLHLYDFYNYWRDFSGNFTTLPQYFKEYGYYTASFGKIFHPGISSNWSDDQPYSWSTKPFHPSSQKFMNAAVCRGDDGNLHRNIICPVVTKFQPEGTLPDLEILASASTFLQNMNNSTLPFFLAVGFHKPHVPLKYPRKYMDFHPLKSIEIPSAHQYPALLPVIAWNPWSDVRKRDDVTALNISFPFGTMPDIFSRKIKQSYNAAVTYIDDLVGQLLGTLKESGYLDNTIVLLTGDHGWSMAEHGEWSKFSNFEISLQVPLLLYVPGLTDFKTNTYKETNVLTELVDIFPTLVDLINPSQSLPLCPEDSRETKLCSEGISLVPVMKQMQNKMNTNRKIYIDWKKGAFSQYPRPGVFPTLHPNSDKPHLRDIKFMGYSLRTMRYRYTEWVSFDNHNFEPNWSNIVGSELYDHYLDPNENFNMAHNKEMEGILKQLSAQLHAGWQFSLPKEYVKKLLNPTTNTHSM